MKKLFLFLAFLVLFINAFSQVPSDTGALRTKINTDIVTNGTKSITATQMHDILIGITNLMKAYGVDSAYRINDTLFFTRRGGFTTIKVVLNSGGAPSESDPTVPPVAKALTGTDTARWNHKQDGLTAGTGIDITSGVIRVLVNSALFNATKLWNNNIKNVAPFPGQVLKWDGNFWTPLNDSVGSVGGGSMDTTGLMRKANNLSDVASVSTSRTNLGLGTSAVLNVPSSGNAASGEVVKGSDTRLTDSRAPNGSASGDLTGSYPSPTLTTTGVTASTYGDATHVPQITVDNKGRLSLVSSITISAGTGDASTNTSTSVDGEAAVFSSTTGKLLKRATGTGVAHLTSGVLSASGVAIADLTASGTPNSTTYLRGDNTWATVSGGGATDLSITHNLKNVDINSSTGNDVTINFAKNTNAGVLSLANYDIGHLPEIKAYMWAKGLQASASATNYPYTLIDSNRSKFISSGPDRGGWLTNNLTGDSVQVRAPFWVAFGDSQAEGHGPGTTGRHGRLDPNGLGGFDPAYPDSTGQITYHLRFLTNMRWYNHGIGGNNTTQALRRFYRDVVGRPGTYTNSDSKGNQTLWYKPQGVVIIVGINDIAQGVALDIIKRNLELMASICQQEGIQCVMLNMPGDEVFDTTQARKVETINKWLAAGVMDQYGTTVVDYNSWWKDATANDNYTGSTLIADDIHPSRVGYDSLSNYIFRAAHLPILKRAIFINELNAGGFTGYSRPTGFTIGGGPNAGTTAYTIANAIDSVTITAPVWDSTWVKTTATTNVTGTTFSGWGSIVWYTENNIDTLRVTKRTLYNNGSQKSDMTINKLTIIPSSYASTDPVLSIPLADITTNSVGLQVYADGGGAWMILNGLTTNAKINNAILSVYGLISTNSNIITEGTNSRIGHYQFLTGNLSANTWGFGQATEGSTFATQFQTTPTPAKNQYQLGYYSGTTTTMGPTANQITTLVDIPMGWGNAGNSGQRGYGINLHPIINNAASGQPDCQIRLLRIVPDVQSLNNTSLSGILQTKGNNFFNALSDSTAFFKDSNAYFVRPFEVLKSAYFSNELNIGDATDQGTQKLQNTGGFYQNGLVNLRGVPSAVGTYTILTHQSATDSSVTQTDIPSFLTAAKIESGTFSSSITNQTNVAASTFNGMQYIRIGDYVSVDAYVAIDPTATGLTVIDLQLPVASSLATSVDVMGLGNCQGFHDQNGTVTANVGAGKATFAYIATDINNQVFYIHFSYRIR